MYSIYYRKEVNKEFAWELVTWDNKTLEGATARALELSSKFTRYRDLVVVRLFDPPELLTNAQAQMYRLADIHRQNEIVN